jgi:hypothetical protein
MRKQGTPTPQLLVNAVQVPQLLTIGCASGGTGQQSRRVMVTVILTCYNI